METFEYEIKSGKRFEFGKNWKSFLATLNDEKIRNVEISLCDMLKIDNLKGKNFLDIGSGSGIFSLAARRLGGSVHSFDYDTVSVECTKELRSKYFSNDNNWIVERGSILDKDYLKSLSKFYVVYAWGVLHHTGNMWKSLENVVNLVEKNGFLFIAIYNDQGIKSKFWLKIKKLYCSGSVGKFFVCNIFIPYFFSRAIIRSIVRKKNIFTEHRKKRGMSVFHDWIDWLGGLPYEVAKVQEIVDYYESKGFELKNMKTTNNLGNNEFVFRKRT